MADHAAKIAVTGVGVLLAPFVIAAIGSLALAAFSLIVRPVSISFRLFGTLYRGDSVIGRFSTSLFSLHPVVAVSILVLAAAVFAAILRSAR
jgi:F0F1-type ATP synthase membrane subunit a